MKRPASFGACSQSIPKSARGQTSFFVIGTCSRQCRRIRLLRRMRLLLHIILLCKARTRPNKLRKGTTSPTIAARTSFRSTKSRMERRKARTMSVTAKVPIQHRRMIKRSNTMHTIASTMRRRLRVFRSLGIHRLRIMTMARRRMDRGVGASHQAGFERHSGRLATFCSASANHQSGRSISPGPPALTSLRTDAQNDQRARLKSHSRPACTCIQIAPKRRKRSDQSRSSVHSTTRLSDSRELPRAAMSARGARSSAPDVVTDAVEQLQLDDGLTERRGEAIGAVANDLGTEMLVRGTAADDEALSDRPVA